MFNIATRTEAKSFKQKPTAESFRACYAIRPETNLRGKTLAVILLKHQLVVFVWFELDVREVCYFQLINAVVTCCAWHHIAMDYIALA